MSLKIKLISCISLFMLMIGVLIIGVFAASSQQLTMEGSVSFNVPDKSLYVKDVRIKQDMASEPTSIDSFMPGYINGDFTLDLTGITDTNTYGSFSLYFDIINTTDIQWTIKDVELPTALTSAGVSASYSGVIPTNNLTDTDSDGFKNFDSSTPIDGSLILTIEAPNSDVVNLEGIVVTIYEYVPPLEISVYTNDENLGTASGGGIVIVGNEVLISADFTGNANADFLGWKTSEADEEFVSTLPDYTFTFEETSPATYVAIFEEPDSHLTYTYNTPASGEAQLTSCSSGAIDIIVPSAIYRSSNSYNVTSMYDGSYNSGVFYQAWSTLQSVSLPETITTIGSNAFWNCSGLTSITLPSSLKSIGYYAFDGCSGLTSIDLSGCTSLTSIGGAAFSACSSLTSITIPEGVTSIGERAFNGCSGLETITVEAGNTVYHSAGNCLIETASGTLIAGCKNSVIPQNGSVTSIGSSTFSGCSGLTSITIPEGVTTIGSNAFWNCSGLTSITLPSSLESIGSSAFSHCSGLTSITIPDSVTNIGSYAFDRCSSLTSITIPAGVTTIGDSAFRSCSGLTSIDLSGCTILTSIGNNAFWNCSGLTSITLPSSLETIGDSAFRSCSGLTSITIPEGVTTISSAAFLGCSKLETVYIDSETIANGITSSSANGRLTYYADTLYIKDTIPMTTEPTGWVKDTTGSGQVSGYNKYIKA